MAKVKLADWKEQIRTPEIECMSRDEMAALQSERLSHSRHNLEEAA